MEYPTNTYPRRGLLQDHNIWALPPQNLVRRFSLDPMQLDSRAPWNLQTSPSSAAQFADLSIVSRDHASPNLMGREMSEYFQSKPLEYIFNGQAQGQPHQVFPRPNATFPINENPVQWNDSSPRSTASLRHSWNEPLAQEYLAHPRRNTLYPDQIPHRDCFVHPRTGDTDAVSAMTLRMAQLELQIDSQDSALLRRHSCGDVYGLRLVGGKPPSGPRRLKSSGRGEVPENWGNVAEKITEYFLKDTHKRVTVTEEFLALRHAQDYMFFGEQYQLPHFTPDFSHKRTDLVLVAFKAGRLDVFFPPENRAVAKAIKPGDLVVVEADRGEDLGKVLRMNCSVDEARHLKLLQALEEQAAFGEKKISDISVKCFRQNILSDSQRHESAPQNVCPVLHRPKSVLGLAEDHDISQLLQKRQDEERACRINLNRMANTIMSSEYSSNEVSTADIRQIELVDAEYQFDRKKLIFYYTTSKRIDFRALVRELFKIYKTRIWMCAVEGVASPQSEIQKQSARRKTPRKRNLDSGKGEPQAAGLLGFNLSAKQDSRVPRNFGRSENEKMEQARAESYVLKSLVDTLNH